MKVKGSREKKRGRESEKRDKGNTWRGEYIVV